MAGPDAVLRQSVVHFPASFQEPVRGCPWAMAVKARLDALRTHLAPQLLDELQADRWMEPLAEVQPDATHRALL